LVEQEAMTTSPESAQVAENNVVGAGSLHSGCARKGVVRVVEARSPLVGEERAPVADSVVGLHTMADAVAEVEMRWMAWEPASLGKDIHSSSGRAQRVSAVAAVVLADNSGSVEADNKGTSAVAPGCTRR
jgi:hypothetical protein